MAKSTDSNARKPKRTVAAARPVTRRRKKPTLDQIAERAYFLHLDGGHDPLLNWLTAERELAGVAA